MAVITNYTTLKTEIAAWLARSDLTSLIPGFVQNAEAQFNRILRTPDQETKDAAFSITGEYVAVPTGFLELRSIALNTTPRRPLTYMSDDQQMTAYAYSSGIPKFVSVQGGNFHFAPVPDGTYEATVVYYTAIPAMELNATNWLVLAHPDIYLYGALLQATAFLQNDPRLPVWREAYADSLGQLTGAGSRKRWGANGMMVRAG